MAGSRETGHDVHNDSELMALRSQLSTLAENANDFPIACSLGAYELLFESRDDIEIIVENLSESIAELQRAA
jgi:hypothetical protein